MKRPKVISLGLRWQDHIAGDPDDTAMHLKYLHQRHASYCKYVKSISIVGTTIIFMLFGVLMYVFVALGFVL